MNKHPALKKTIVVLGSVSVMMAAYLLWARPLQLHWGATYEEV